MGSRLTSQAIILALLAAASAANAQDRGTLEPHLLPALAHPDDPKTPAKALFGRKVTPTSGEAHAVGFYANGCLAGGSELPINGPAWQVMRLSRNRNWGHPALVGFWRNWPSRCTGPGPGTAFWSATCRSRAAVR